MGRTIRFRVRSKVVRFDCFFARFDARVEEGFDLVSLSASIGEEVRKVAFAVDVQ